MSEHPYLPCPDRYAPPDRHGHSRYRPCIRWCISGSRFSRSVPHSHRPALRPVPGHAPVQWKNEHSPARPYSLRNWSQPSAHFLSGLTRWKGIHRSRCSFFIILLSDQHGADLIDVLGVVSSDPPVCLIQSAFHDLCRYGIRKVRKPHVGSNPKHRV